MAAATDTQPSFSEAAALAKNYSFSQDAMALWEDIETLRLERYVAELDVKGYTVIPPEMVGPPEFIDRLRSTVLDIAERRHGVRPDVLGGATHQDHATAFGERLTYLLLEDRVFQEALLNPVGLTLATYLLGNKCIVSNCIALLKGPGHEDLHLHADHALIPAPFPQNAEVCNVTWLLSDYSRANGALCHVPGSHRAGRHPLPGEALANRVPVEAKAGSIVFWHGSTWHGAFARQTPGMRMNILFAMMRPHLRPQEPYRENVTPQILDSHPPRFAVLVGQHLNYGWKEEGPSGEATAYEMGRSAYD